MRKAQEVERLRASRSACSPVPFGVPAKLDESDLVGVQFQPEASESLLQIPQEAFRIVPMLEPGDVIICVAHYDQVAARFLRSPLLGDPQVQHVVQVDIRERR